MIFGSVDRVASGFRFTEGPLVLPDHEVLFSDIHASRIYCYSRSGVSVRLDTPGIHPNGLALDASGSIIICEHGRRCISKLTASGQHSVLVDSWHGQRLNSPNDLVIHSTGAIYFTDPPYGLTGQDADPLKELPFNGIFRWFEGKLTLLCSRMTRPNGLAFSHDEHFLYVANSDPQDTYWHRYPLEADGTLGTPDRWYSLSSLAPGLPDGLKILPDGNILATGPGGLLLISPEGHLMAHPLPLPEVPANLAFALPGTIWVTARTSLYRLSLTTQYMR